MARVSRSAAFAAGIFLAGFLPAVLGFGVARAQDTLAGDSPRCAQMVNVAACNCALQNGGAVRPDGRGFTDGRGPAARAGYVECMKRKGRAP